MFGWQLPIQIRDHSNIDDAVACSLGRYYGYDPDNIAAVLLHGRDKAAERRMDYICRPVNATASPSYCS